MDNSAAALPRHRRSKDNNNNKTLIFLNTFIISLHTFILYTS